ncbi:formyl transferase [Nemania abortiva]|nr:formyl transferase [Nemania abortiva]
MSHIFASFMAAAKSVAILFPPHSSQHIALRNRASYCFNHGHYYVTTDQRRYTAAAPFFHQGRRYSTTQGKISDPLHILFCGSDDFSCASLQALHHEHVQNPSLIRSIDVVVRPGKRTGRGYKVVRDPPLRGLADSLGLKIHERDTFTGWDIPTRTNLIIAVSFGLFVPPRLLRAAKYGGLNLHPSLLPDLRGPAPLQHTLLTGRRFTGVSLQTLDEKAFDHGVVLAQTPSDPAQPGALLIPPACRTVAGLQALVTPPATEILIRGLRAALHVPPLQDQGWTPTAEQRAHLVHAPKITKGDRRLSLALLRTCASETSTLDSFQGIPGTLARRQDAIGPLWFFSRDRQGRKKRIIIESLEEMPLGSLDGVNMPMVAETPASTTTARETSTLSHRQYLIPFEEEGDPVEEGGEEERQSRKSGMNLVFWDASQLFSSILTSGQGSQLARDGNEVLCLGHYRILSLKVEGEKAKPTLMALRHFIIN